MAVVMVKSDEIYRDLMEWCAEAQGSILVDTNGTGDAAAVAAVVVEHLTQLDDPPTDSDDNVYDFHD